MAKVNVVTIQNLTDNPTTATAQINLNFERIQEVIDLLVSRDGSLPNAILANLDLNNFRITNLPAPTSDTEPARHGDIQTYVDDAETAATEAEAARDIAVSSRDAALVAETNAETAETNAETAATAAQTAQAAAEAAQAAAEAAADGIVSSVDADTIVVLSQAAYTALDPKDPTTLYLITAA